MCEKSRQVQKQKERQQQSAEQKCSNANALFHRDRQPRQKNNRPGKISPKRPPRKPWRPDPSSRTRKEEMLNAESHHRQAVKNSSELREPIHVFRFSPLAFFSSGRSDHQRAPAHRQRHKSARPLVAVSRALQNSRRMHDQNKNKKHHSQKRRPQPGPNPENNRQSRRYKSCTDKVGPEKPCRNPRRHKRRHKSGIDKVLSPEHEQRAAEEYTSKRGDSVHRLFFIFFVEVMQAGREPKERMFWRAVL